MPSAVNHGLALDKEQTHPYRPMPNPITGALVVDPEINLKTAGFDLQMEFYYSSQSGATGAFGQKRSANFNAYATPVTSTPNYVYMVRGDGSPVVYDQAG